METVYLLIYTNLKTGYKQLLEVFADRVIAEESMSMYQDWNDGDESYEIVEKVLN